MKQQGKILVLFVILFSECSKEKPDIKTDKDGVVISQPYLWKTKVSNKDFVYSQVVPNIIFDNGVLLAAKSETGEDKITFLDITNGAMKWQANHPDESGYFLMQDFYQYNNILLFVANGNIAQLNLANGLYGFSNQVLGSTVGILCGVDSIYFITRQVAHPSNPELNIDALYYGNVDNATNFLLLLPPFNDLPDTDMLINNNVGGFRYILPFKDNETGDNMLLCYYEKTYYYKNKGDEIYHTLLRLYNFSEKKWAGNEVIIGEDIYGSVLYSEIANNVCYNLLLGGICEARELYTGNLIWCNEGSFVFSPNGLLAYEDKILFIDNSTGYLIALNSVNGDELWRVQADDSPSIIYGLNGVAYFVISTSGNLFAVDMSNGKLLWKISSDVFKTDIKVEQGTETIKGKIIVSSFTHAYCYEAAK